MSTPPCAHPNAISVESAGEVVAALCPDCDQQLPAAWLDCNHEWPTVETIDISTYVTHHEELMCVRCGGIFSGMSRC